MYGVTVIGKRYVLAERLGGGGYGEVFRAHDRNTGLTVALKLFRRGEPSMLAYREAHVLYRLTGPHVLAVHNAETYDDVPCVATDVAPLGSAADHVGTLGASPGQVLTWMAHLLDGLGACHAVGVLHRDVKAENLFLERLDHARLGDFGAAAELGPDGTAAAGGDHRVWPPEMFSEYKADVRGDVWAAGVTAWRLLTGAYPFQAATVDELHQLTLQGPGRLVDAAPHVPPALARAIEKALRPNREGRYQTAKEMALALDLPRFHRLWRRIPPHPGHLECWDGPSADGRSPATVCTRTTVGKGGKPAVAVDARRGQQLSRVREYCNASPPSRLAVNLRKVFKGL